MKYKYAILCAILIVLFLHVNFAFSASQEDDYVTFTAVGLDPKDNKEVGLNLYNGRFWKTLNDSQKPAFIAGIQEGVLDYYINSDVSTTSEYKKYENIRTSYFIPGYKRNEVANMIDNVYTDSTNLRIPIIEVLKCLRKKVGGASKNELDNIFSELRRKYYKANLK